MGSASDNCLAVEIEFKPQHPMGSRMLRPHADCQFLSCELPLNHTHTRPSLFIAESLHQSQYAAPNSTVSFANFSRFIAEASAAETQWSAWAVHLVTHAGLSPLSIRSL